MTHVADKLRILGEEARFDLSCSCGTTATRVRDPVSPDRWLYPSVLPDGRRAVLLKVLMDNACSRSCAYCAQRAGRKVAHHRFSPDELAKTFVELNSSGRASGLFLSSAIPGRAGEAMEAIVRTGEIVRSKYGFKGFVHLKVLPGATFDQVAEAAQLADRLSVNLEQPTAEALRSLCPQKELDTDLLERMRWIEHFVRDDRSRVRGQTTQFVVGAAGESDRQILERTSSLYGDLTLARAYFSAFHPVNDTPLEWLPPAPLEREHRLYQADFLFRQYRFDFADLTFDETGNLSLEKDPKLIWAERHPEFFPVEVNSAEIYELLRVPGIGPVSAKRIVKRRIKDPLRNVEDLKLTGAVVKRASSYVTVGGRRAQMF